MRRPRPQAAARPALLCACLALFAGCGSTAGSRRAGDGIPRLDFAYDASAPLGYVDRGRINRSSYPIAIHDVSFRSGGRRVEGFLLEPPGSQERPAVVVVPGAGADRGELLAQAAWLAARDVVTLTITPPSSRVTGTPSTARALLAQARAVTVQDVVAVRRALDLLRTLPVVDGSRLGYVGWSLGAKTGTFLAAAEPRLGALVLLSAGADPLSAFLAHAPASLRGQVRRVLGSVDPIRYVAWAKPGSLLLEDGTQDEVVPRQALLNVVRAAPHGTVHRWYRAGHALDAAAYHDAFEWLAQKLGVQGPPVAGAATGP